MKESEPFMTQIRVTPNTIETMRALIVRFLRLGTPFLFSEIFVVPGALFCRRFSPAFGRYGSYQANSFLSWACSIPSDGIASFLLSSQNWLFLHFTSTCFFLRSGPSYIAAPLTGSTEEAFGFPSPFHVASLFFYRESLDWRHFFCPDASACPPPSLFAVGRLDARPPPTHNFLLFLTGWQHQRSIQPCCALSSFFMVKINWKCFSHSVRVDDCPSNCGLAYRPVATGFSSPFYKSLPIPIKCL